jgi:hypothetical protein
MRPIAGNDDWKMVSQTQQEQVWYTLAGSCVVVSQDRALVDDYWSELFFIYNLTTTQLNTSLVPMYLSSG